jgi:hypothetical protein
MKTKRVNPMSCTTLTYRGIVHQKPARKNEERLVRVHDAAPRIYRGAVYHYESRKANKKSASV